MEESERSLKEQTKELMKRVNTSRVRPEEPTFIDISSPANNSEEIINLRRLFREREIHHRNEVNAKKEMEEYEEERKLIDALILLQLDEVVEDGVILNGDLLERVRNKGQEKTDWDFLRKVLAPEQLSKAKKSGTPYVYLKTTVLKD